jgi:DNA-binding transcriptional regulator GbsR (MarR family)
VLTELSQNGFGAERVAGDVYAALVVTNEPIDDAQN